MLGYLGPEGTHTERAARFFCALFPARNFDCRAYSSIGDVLDAVERGEVEAAAAPLENSLEGSVLPALDRLASGTLHIAAEVALPIRHTVFGLPGTRVEAVRRVLSHPQALAQCRETLNGLFPGATHGDTPSTAAAVWQVREGGDPTVVCVASSGAGLSAGLSVLYADAQDAADNVTRFALLVRADSETARESLSRPVAGRIRIGNKTSVLLALGDDHPGALFEVLRAFAEHGVNLTRLESRPTRKGLGSYRFYIDLSGRFDDPSVQAAMAEIRLIPDFSLAYLGSYPCYAPGETDI